MVFRDRIEAGSKLAQVLNKFKGKSVGVYALPRGGVVVGAEVAKHLNAPLALIFSCKIIHPLSPEYAIGAVTDKGDPFWNMSGLAGISGEVRQRQLDVARTEAKRRRLRYAGRLGDFDTSGKIAIVVDDGIATGLSMIAATNDIRMRNPAKVIVAVPVAPQTLPRELTMGVDEIIILYTPMFFESVGSYYRHYNQVEDEEVRQLIKAYRDPSGDEPLDITALNALAKTVNYPITNKQVAAQARRMHAPSNIVKFFESIPGEIIFKDRKDMMIRSEEAFLLMAEEQIQSKETQRSYE